MNISSAAYRAAADYLERQDDETLRLARIIDQAIDKARAEERERCVKIAIDIGNTASWDHNDARIDWTAKDIAAAIRASDGGEGE